MEMKRRKFLVSVAAMVAATIPAIRTSADPSTGQIALSREISTGGIAKIAPPPFEEGDIYARWQEDRKRIKEAQLTHEEIASFFPGAHAHTVTIDVPPGMYGYATFLDRGVITLNPGANIIQGKKPSTATLKSVDHGETESIYHWKIADGERVVTKDIVIPK
jgi:hypothetical protein